MKIFALIMVLIAGTMWAGTGIAAQVFFSKSSYNAVDLTVFRMIFAGTILLLYTIATKEFKRNWTRMKEKPRLWLEVAFYGIVGLMLMHITYFGSIETGNAAVATVIQYTCPALVILWVAFSERRIPNQEEIAAVVFAVGGAFLLATGGDVSSLSVSLVSVILAVLSAVFFAVCAVFPKHLLGELDNSFILMIGMFIGGLAIWIFDPSVSFEGFFERNVIFESVWIVVCGTVLAFACYNAGLHYLTPDQASVTSTIEPAVSVVGSYFLFGLTFNKVQFIGICMVLFAIVLPVIFSKKTQEKTGQALPKKNSKN